MPDQVADLVRLVRRRIAETADPSRAPRMQAYMKSAMPYRGVSSVPLRRLLTEVYGDHRLSDRDAWEACVRELWDTAEHREERYAAMALTGHRSRAYQDPGTLGLYRHLVVTGAWWDYVDALASHQVGQILATHSSPVSAVMRDWAVAEDLWLRRTAILCQLNRGADTDVGLLRDSIEANLENSPFGREFFIRKAIGWALRQQARVDAAWVRAFVVEHEVRLPALSRREALRHL